MKRIIWGLAAVVLLVASATSARAGLLGSDANGVLYDVNSSTGAATNARATGISSLVGVAFSPSGTLYGLTTFAGSSPNSLYTINPTTGAATLVGSTGLSNIFEGDLGFDPTTGLLYGLQNVPNPGDRILFRMNPGTGAATTVGNIPAPNSDLSAMAFDAAGNLYVLDNGQEKLFKVNKGSAGIITSVGLSSPLGDVAGMSFDPSSGVLYVADGHAGGTKNLYTLNTSTGTLSLVGATGTPDGLAGLAFTPPGAAVPEPASVILLGLGVGTLGGYALRRRKHAV